MLKSGTFIQNRYEIIARIGTGGMADVYKAKDHKLNRFIAVKVLKKEFREDTVFISKFRVEAQSAAGLAHANIVNVYDVGEEAGISYIVMELVEGITLKDYINNKGHLSVREATSIALQISAGLEAAHNNGIIHRDVKPQNIIISTDGKVKVTDFGIARAASANTINSNVMGSVHYSSPEQSRGGYSDEKSDIYSLGITMYEMLTGKVPFDGDTAVAVAIRHLQEEIHGPKELVPEVPYSTNQIVMKCTQKSPDRRYTNMAELIRDLRESLVNPEGNFVTELTPDRTSKTIIISKEEVEQINSERNMPSYDETMDVGAAAGLHAQENEPKRNRAYQPGSYYQKSQYQGENYDGNRWNDEYDQDDAEQGYDPYYDAYDDPSDYAIHDGRKEANYRLEESFVPKKEKKRRDDDQEIGLNPKLEKIVTVGGVIVAVIIGCVFLALIANAFGLLNFGNRKNVKPKETEILIETETEAQTEKVQLVSVPEILGRTEEEAIALLKTYGLSGQKTGEADSELYDPGEVCTQNPVQGEMVEKGSVISFEVMPADALFTLSELTGSEQSQAQAFLLTKGLLCTIDNSQYSETVEKGYVISTSPAAGEKVKAGDTITLYVSQGSQQDVTYVTPWSLYLYTEERATEALNMLGLIPEYVYEYSDTVGSGLVISQSAAANEQVARGSTVTLVISSGPAPAGQSQESQTVEDNIVIDNGGEGTWRCDASLVQPTGYNGQPVRITLVQNGSESTIFEGTTSFPYYLAVQGAAGIETGTAYVYILDEVTGEVISKIEYPGIAFNKVN